MNLITKDDFALKTYIVLLGFCENAIKGPYLKSMGFVPRKGRDIDVVGSSATLHAEFSVFLIVLIHDITRRLVFEILDRTYHVKRITDFT